MVQKQPKKVQKKKKKKKTKKKKSGKKAKNGEKADVQPTGTAEVTSASPEPTEEHSVAPTRPPAHPATSEPSAPSPPSLPPTHPVPEAKKQVQGLGVFKAVATLKRLAKHAAEHQNRGSGFNIETVIRRGSEVMSGGDNLTLTPLSPGNESLLLEQSGARFFGKKASQSTAADTLNLGGRSPRFLPRCTTGSTNESRQATVMQVTVRDPSEVREEPVVHVDDATVRDKLSRLGLPPGLVRHRLQCPIRRPRLRFAADAVDPAEKCSEDVPALYIKPGETVSQRRLWWRHQRKPQAGRVHPGMMTITPSWRSPQVPSLGPGWGLHTGPQALPGSSTVTASRSSELQRQASDDELYPACADPAWYQLSDGHLLHPHDDDFVEDTVPVVSDLLLSAAARLYRPAEGLQLPTCTSEASHRQGAAGFGTQLDDASRGSRGGIDKTPRAPAASGPQYTPATRAHRTVEALPLAEGIPDASPRQSAAAFDAQFDGASSRGGIDKTPRLAAAKGPLYTPEAPKHRAGSAATCSSGTTGSSGCPGASAFRVRGSPGGEGAGDARDYADTGGRPPLAPGPPPALPREQTTFTEAQSRTELTTETSTVPAPRPADYRRPPECPSVLDCSREVSPGLLLAAQVQRALEVRIFGRRKPRRAIAAPPEPPRQPRPPAGGPRRRPVAAAALAA
eukprot:TRINITY_DN1746_c0_g2_i1.p1 TRINITY_DN1746_c0_g2~~TRINITY_DN1746_c0_g2_i1.p1  ORF type:complete len:705 (+),score=88.96 TRINITY_DN1746_c0_g2_i1:84-2117(+)